MGRQVLAYALCLSIGALLNTAAGGGDWYLEQIQCPLGLSPATNGRAVVVAVVDDGLLLTHDRIRPYLWKHPGEVPGNRVDDDGNGRIDDVHGWDAADGDADVVPPRHRRDALYHGTHLAGIIARMAETAYGGEAPARIRIMPVKCLSDSAQQTYLTAAYQGIEYALDNGADIILCAWGLGQASPEEIQILDRVREQDVLLVASAGNLPEEREQYPAAHPGALAVSALDRADQKLTNATFGCFVDLMAPGLDISGADVNNIRASTNRTGTSYSAAIVAGAAAILKCQHPGLTRDDIRACLVNTAVPLEPDNPNQHAKWGAGKINLSRALARAGTPFIPGPEAIRSASKGYLRLQGQAVQSWLLEPPGRIAGFRFRFDMNRVSPGGTLTLYRGADASAKPVIRALSPDMDPEIFIAGPVVSVVFEPGSAPAAPSWLAYTAEPIDLSTLYCRGTQYVDAEGVIEDGSGPNPYSPLTNGKWLITAPAGKDVHFKFTEFDTETDVDKIYFFDGTGTHDLIMAVFTGAALPPELTSWSNQVLVWFVSDGKNEGQGWRAAVTFVDAQKQVDAP